MLPDKILEVLEALDTTITDIARYGGCSPSNLSRVKNGVRTPPPYSPTIRSLTNGMIEAASAGHRLDELCSLCGAAPGSDREQLRRALTEWLYIDEAPYERTYNRHTPANSADRGAETSEPAAGLPVFSRRLSALMDSASLSNRKLALGSGLDPSYISRLRRGERLPRFNAPYLTSLCLTIWDAFDQNGRLSVLSGLISRSEEELSRDDAPDVIREWLFGNDTIIHQLAVDELVKAIDSIGDTMKIAAAKWVSSEETDLLIEKCIESGKSCQNCDNEKQGIGINGIRTLSALFLAEAIMNDEHELMLYSDQSMEWMSGDYLPVLTALMAECISRNIHIRIIHTVDRSMKELTAAISWWLPLYLSGNIKSYYCTKSAGQRFSHTLFIRPGNACIAGTSVFGMEDKTIYSYSTSPEIASLAEDSFRSLLEASEPLVNVDSARPEDTETSSENVTIEKVRVQASPERVVISRTEEPLLSFTFTHPMICRAFIYSLQH